MSRLLIVILAALSMLGALSIDAYLPALPAIAAEFSATDAAVQQTLTAYVLAFAIMTLFYGTLSDSFGRRPVILISLFFYLLSSVGTALANSLEMLIVFRLFQGFSAGGGAVVARAIVGDMVSGAKAHRAMSYINVVFGLAPAIAPILGGWLQSAFGWRSIFIFITLFTLVLLVACAVFLRESLPLEKRAAFQLRVVLANYWKVGSHGFFILRSISTALAFSGIMIYVAAAPAFIINILHLSVTDFGWLFLPLIGGMILGSFAAGRLSHRVKPRAIISASFVIMLVAMAVNLAYCAWFPVRVPWAVLPLFIYAFGAALGTPVMSMITLEMFPRMRGLAASFQTFLFMLLFALVSGIIVPLLFGSPFKFALGTGVGAVLSLVCWVLSSSARRPAAR